MTEMEFRAMHSKLIGYYQMIEMRLRFICATLHIDKKRDWFDKLDDYEADPFGSLTRKIRMIQGKNQITLLTQNDFEELDVLRERRNYWVHGCFIGYSPVIFKKGEVKKLKDVKIIMRDLDNAIEWNTKLTEIGKPL